MPLLLTILLSIAVAAISVTISKSELFAPLREWIGWRVLKCPYCTSHWVAFIVVAVANPNLGLSPNRYLNWFLTSMVIVGIAPRIAWWIYSSYAGMKKVKEE